MRLLLAMLAFGLIGCGGTIVDPYLDQLDALQEQINNLPQGSVVELVDPCPTVDATHKEQLVCVDNEVLFALFYSASADELFLSELSAGTYVTTDSRSCTFTVVEGCFVYQGAL